MNPLGLDCSQTQNVRLRRLARVLSGDKTLEVRGAAFKAGEYWFGMGGQRQSGTASNTQEMHQA